MLNSSLMMMMPTILRDFKGKFCYFSKKNLRKFEDFERFEKREKFAKSGESPKSNWNEAFKWPKSFAVEQKLLRSCNDLIRSRIVRCYNTRKKLTGCMQRAKSIE